MPQKARKPWLLPEWNRRLELSTVAASGEIPEACDVHVANLVDLEHFAQRVAARPPISRNKPDGIAGEPPDGFLRVDGEGGTVVGIVPGLLNLVILNEVL